MITTTVAQPFDIHGLYNGLCDGRVANDYDIGQLILSHAQYCLGADGLDLVSTELKKWFMSELRSGPEEIANAYYGAKREYTNSITDVHYDNPEELEKILKRFTNEKMSSLDRNRNNFMEQFTHELLELGYTEMNILPIVRKLRVAFDASFELWLAYLFWEEQNSGFKSPEIGCRVLISVFEQMYPELIGRLNDVLERENVREVLRFMYERSKEYYDKLSSMNIEPTPQCPRIFSDERSEVFRLFEWRA